MTGGSVESVESVGSVESELLESVEADELHYQKDADKEGYLVQDESREYNFYLGNVRNKKASTHYLRLVKPVRFVVKN